MNISEASKQWEKAAPGWAKWEDVISEGAGRITNKMVEMAEISPGDRVIDLACGAGSQSIVVSKVVGPKGHVVANDISPTMLEHVKRNATKGGISNISTLLGPVQELGLSHNSFDAAICRFALMLFVNPEIVIAKVLEILKPKGKMGVIVFSSPEENPFFVNPMQILLRHAGKKPPIGGPGLFSLSVSGALEKLFSENGFENIAVKKQYLTFKMPPANDSLIMMQEAFGAYRAVISDSSEDVQKRAWSEVLEYLKSLEGDSGVEAPSQVLIASAQKPA